MTTSTIDILARTIYGEARGESITGMEAVASVILNRVKFSKNKKKHWWGHDIKTVCLKSRQFSCWNKSDPNYQIINNITDKDEIFSICKRVASRAAAGLLEDKISGATHYHTKKIRPKWSVGKIPCAEVGSHLFYNDIEE